MTVVLKVISLLVLVIAIILFAYKKYSERKVSVTKCLVLPAVVCVLIFVLSCSFTIIPTNYSGVKTTFGQIDSKSLSDGLNRKLPFVQKIETVNNKLQDIEFSDTISSETSARTEIRYKNITVTYQISKAKSAWIFANVSDYEDNLISQDLVGSAVKSISKTLNDTDATNRSVLEPAVAKSIQSSIDDKYGKNVVKIHKVVVKGADFTKDYNKSIADKQRAQLESEKQAIQNKKNIDKAKADAEVKKTQAKASADAKLISAQADKKANELKEKSITDNILKDKYISKWNGVMPKYTGGNSSVMLDMQENK